LGNRIWKMRTRGNLPDGRKPKKKKTKMSPMDAATYNALALLLLLFPPSLPFTQQRRWRSAPRTKESGSGSNFSNSWRFGAPWAPHAQKQLLDFKSTQNEHFLFKKEQFLDFESHPKLKIYSKAFSQNKYPWISQSPKTKIPPKQPITTNS
jgi:hypothetical protein